MHFPLLGLILLPFAALADSFTEELDYLFLNDELSFDSYMQSDFVAASESTENGGLFALGGEPTNLITDLDVNQFLISDVSSFSDSCLPPSKRSRIRARGESAICDTPADEKKPAADAGLLNIEDQVKYWCSATSVLGISNIPVCNYGDNFDTKTNWFDFEAGSVTLQKSKRSKFYPLRCWDKGRRVFGAFCFVVERRNYG